METLFSGVICSVICSGHVFKRRAVKFKKELEQTQILTLVSSKSPVPQYLKQFAMELFIRAKNNLLRWHSCLVDRLRLAGRKVEKFMITLHQLLPGDFNEKGKIVNKQPLPATSKDFCKWASASLQQPVLSRIRKPPADGP